MDPVEGARSFTSDSAYDRFMGRYSQPLAVIFADAAGVVPGLTALDVGCGPGALTAVLAARLGTSAVAATDPAPPFVAACAGRLPGVDVRPGRAEQLPFDDDRFDVALAQLVLHFVSDPATSAAELRRVVKPGGVVAACMWDFDDGMEMLRHFWDAALAADPSAPDEARRVNFGGVGEIAELFRAAGLHHITETTLEVSSTYRDFDELWDGFMAGIGPAGQYCVALGDDQRAEVRGDLFRRVGSPAGPFTLLAVARSACGRVPAA